MNAIKEKIKKSKLGFIGIIVAIIIAIISIFIIKANADDTSSYVIDVINANDKEEDAVSDGKIKIQKQIIKNNNKEPYYNNKDLTYEVKVSNDEDKKKAEIALVVDTSYSTSINAENLLKESACELVERT